MMPTWFALCIIAGLLAYAPICLTILWIADRWDAHQRKKAE